MKRLKTLGFAALIVAGCDSNENALTIDHVIIPELDTMTGICSLSPDGAPVAGPLVLDTAAAVALSTPFSVRNNLALRTSNFSTNDIDTEVVKRNEVTPLRFAARFECDTSAYSGAVANGLILPRIDPRFSFCIDDRGEARATEENSDILPASGAALPAGGSGVAVVQTIPHELGRAIDELFQIARLADGCCRNTADCAGELNNADCRALQTIFEQIDSTGSLNASGQAGTPNLTLRKFADYAIYEGDYITSVDPGYRGRVGTPAFPLILRGQLEGVTGYGEIVESNDYSVQIDVCRNCGLEDPMGGRGPRGEFPPCTYR